MKLGNVYFFIKPWFRFGFLRISSEQWQLKIGFILIQRMPANWRAS